MANDGALFQSYLDVQAHFDRYSVGNALLITAQKPDAKQLADFKGWDISKPFGELPEEVRRALVYGSDEKIPMIFETKHGDWEYNGHYPGLIPWLEKRYGETESENYREELMRYRVEDECSSCHGARLRPEALAVTLGGYNIAELSNLTVEEHIKVLDGLKLGKQEQKIVGQAVNEVRKRLAFLVDVGAGYLTLSRRADTLSGGESQRIRLATQIGSQLTGVLYVLDEITAVTSDCSKRLYEVRKVGNRLVLTVSNKGMTIFVK